jgi:hypothetical protein
LPGEQAKGIHELLTKKRAQFLSKLSEVKEAFKYGPDANPPVDLRIVPLDQFIGLTSRLEGLIQFVD